MPRKYSTALAAALAAITNQTAHTTALVSSLGTDRRIRIFHDPNGGTDPFVSGLEVLNIGASGPMTVDSATAKIKGHGTLGNTTVKAATNLAVGTACMRIEGNGTWAQYPLGLSGAKDILLSGNLTATSGISLKNLTISPPSNLPLVAGSLSLGAEITTVTLVNTSLSQQNNVPVVFGQVFKPLDLMATGAAVQFKLPDNSIVPVQLDVKATHADGSVRHALLSAVIPAMAASEVMPISIQKTSAVPATPATIADFPNLDSVVSIVESGVTYTASLASALANTTPNQWMSGGVVTEWLVPVKFKDASGNEHPLLHARFHARGFKGQAKAKIDVIIENTWVKPDHASTTETWINSNMGTKTYDVTVTVGGVQVFSQNALAHYPYARWKKTFWWNTAAPSVHIKHNIAYLIASKALPNFDTGIAVSMSTVASLKNTLLTKMAPMQVGIAEAYMPQTGGRDDIALLPGWDVRYLLSMDVDAKFTTLTQGDLAGSWSANYRNYDTDLPVSVADYPYMMVEDVYRPDTFNPATGKYEAFFGPPSGGNPNSMQTAHHPDCSFVPYLVTGDYYYLETLQFWAEFCAFHSNPGYRTATHDVFKDETRGQGWAIRTVSHAAYITPDSHPLKAPLTAILQHNIAFYEANYVNSSNPEMALGIMYRSAIGYQYDTTTGTGNTTGVATWQDDYFTSAVGRAVELGFTFAENLLKWKARFPTLRMTSGPDFCYIFASNFSLNVMDSTATTYFTTMAQIYQNTPSITANMRNAACASQAMADAITAKYSDSRVAHAGQLVLDGGTGFDGYASLMQPALAYSVDSGIANADNAWLVYTNRTYKNTDVAAHPQFSILPRN